MRKLVPIIAALLLLQFIYATPAFAKKPSRKELYETKIDTIQGIAKVELILSYARDFYFSNDDKFHAIIHEATEVNDTLSTITEDERIYGATYIQMVKNFKFLYQEDFADAFRGTLIVDSLASQIAQSDSDKVLEKSYLFRLESKVLRSNIFSQQHYYDKASYEISEYLKLAEEAGNSKWLANAYGSLAYYKQMEEKVDESEFYYLKADSVYRALGTVDFVYLNHISRVNMLCASKNFEKANSFYPELIDSARLRAPRHLHNVFCHYAQILLHADRLDEAKVAIDSTEKIAAKLGNQLLAVEILDLKIEYAEKTGKTENLSEIWSKRKEVQEKSNELSFSEELFELQNQYFAALNATDNSTSFFEKYGLALLPLLLVGLIPIFLFRRKQKELTSSLEIEWKNEKPEKQSDPFVERFIMEVQKHLDEGDISVDQVASSMKISRVYLFKKIKSSTGESPSFLIRKIKLEMAKRLLLEKAGTISEIAYRVGFSNPNSFSRSFKEHFGMAPSKVAISDSSSHISDS